MLSLEPELKRWSPWVVSMVATTGITGGEPWGSRGKVRLLTYLLACIHFYRSHFC